MRSPEPPDLKSITNDGLMLWIMHALGDEFRDHAILKGGMQLMLLSSERATNDLDYVFTPFASKRDIEPTLDAIFAKLSNAQVQKSFHSNTGRYRITIGKAAVQLEYNVAISVASTSLTTQLLAARVGALPRVIRVMSPEVAFAHKLAAWNERRLLRDIYDCYYWYAIVRVHPDLKTLNERLAAVNSRLPEFKKTKRMSLSTFLQQFEGTIQTLTETLLTEHLGALVVPSKLNGLLPVLKAQLNEFIVKMRMTLDDDKG